MQTEIDLREPEPECPGYDVCPIGACGCRWLGIGTPWREAGQDGTKRDISPNVTPDSGTGQDTHL